MNLSRQALDARGWPEGVAPTPEQWLDWMLGLERSDQIQVANRVIEANHQAADCFVQNHVGASSPR